MRIELFKAIVEKLKNLQDSKGDPFFKYLDMDRRQITNPKFPVNLLPCGLISFPAMRFEDLNDETQEGQVSFAVDTYLHAYGESWHAASDQDTTLEQLRVLDEVFKALQWLFIDGLCKIPFVRSAEQPIAVNHPGVLGYRTLFSGEIYDATLQEEEGQSIPKPSLNIQE